MNMETKKKIDLKMIFPFCGLAAVILFFEIITGGMVFTQRNISALINESFMIIIGNVGFTFIIAQGNLDLSMGSVMAVSCVCGALAANVYPILALPFAVLPGLALGWVNGMIHVKLKLNSLITTMITMSIFSGILTLALNGGSIATAMSILKWNTMSLKLGTILLVVVVGGYVFNFTAFGKHCRAIGACAETSRLTGFHVGRIKILAYMVLGGLCGLLGFFSLIRTGTASSSTGSELMMNVWCAALLGGLPLTGGYATKYRAAIIGSLTMTFLSNGMVLMGLGTFDKQLIRGIIFLITVAISFDRKNMVVIK